MSDPSYPSDTTDRALTDHPSREAGATQCEAILQALRDANADWVPMPVLWQASGAFAVHSRISDLRRRGHWIEHKNVRGINGQLQSLYRLLDAQPAAALALAPALSTEPRPSGSETTSPPSPIPFRPPTSQPSPSPVRRERAGVRAPAHEPVLIEQDFWYKSPVPY